MLRERNNMLKVKGIFAYPGAIQFGGKTEIVTAEELMKATQRCPIIPIVGSHPVSGLPMAKDVIGTLHQKYDQANQRVNFEAWFHEESVDQELAEKLQRDQFVPISPGYTIDSLDMTPEGNIQVGRMYTHAAVVDKPRREGVGFNARAESDESSPLLRYDPTLVRTESADPPETKPAEPKPEAKEPTKFTEEQIAQIRALLSEEKPVSPPEGGKTEPASKPAEPAPKTPEKTAPKAEPAPEPEVRIPKGRTPSKEPYKVNELGKIVFSLKAPRKEKEK